MKFLHMIGILGIALSLGGLAVLNEQAVGAAISAQISSQSVLAGGYALAPNGRVYVAANGYKLASTSPWVGTFAVQDAEGVKYQASFAAVTFQSANEATISGKTAAGKTLTLHLQGNLLAPAASYDVDGATDLPLPMPVTGLVRIRE